MISHGASKHIFTNFAPDNYYTDEDVLDEIYASTNEYLTAPERYATAKTTVFAISATISVLIVLYALRKVAKTKKKYDFYEPTFNWE